jgi:hypothetical protein
MAYHVSGSCSVPTRVAAYFVSVGFAATSFIASVLTGGSKRCDMPGPTRRLVHVIWSVALTSARVPECTWRGRRFPAVLPSHHAQIA